jgi:hypothetical protein
VILTAAEETALGRARYYAIMPAVVIDRNDPLGLHRVRVEVLGLIERSAWAKPITLGGGSPQRGGHVVPALGADVWVWFIGGDVEQPVYAGGSWGAAPAGKETPADVAEVAGTDPAKVQSIELDDVRITVDERDGKRALSIASKATGDFVTVDLTNHGLHVKMTAAIILECLGLISLEAAAITLNGRNVLPNSEDIG